MCGIVVAFIIGLLLGFGSALAVNLGHDDGR